MVDKRERFVRLAEARTAKAIKSIRLLSNLANRSNYAYDESELNQILKALDTEMKHLRAVYASAARSDEDGFRLNKASSSS